MTNISSWHVIDRCLACILMSMELVRIVVARPYTRPLIYILYLSCCGAAICESRVSICNSIISIQLLTWFFYNVCLCNIVVCFLKSQESQNSLNADGFVFWHNCWHCYPLAGSFIQLLDLAWDRRLGHNSFGWFDFMDDWKETDNYLLLLILWLLRNMNDFFLQNVAYFLVLDTQALP